MADPMRVVIEATGKPVGFACKCGVFFSSHPMADGDNAEIRATEHCDRELVAARRKAEEERRRAEFEERSARADAERLAKAKRIPAKDYEGPVYVDGDEFFRDVEDFEDSLDEDAPLPQEVWACTTQRLRIPSAEEIISRATEDDAHDGAFDDLFSMKEFAAFEEAVNAFNAAIRAETWFPDFSRRVVLASPRPSSPEGV